MCFKTMFKYERPIITLFIMGVLGKCELLACWTSHFIAAHEEVAFM